MDGQEPLTEEDWRQAVQQVAATVRAQGLLPAHMEEVVGKATQSTIDWRTATRRFAQEMARTDYTWRLPNRRYLAQGLYLPALYNEEVGVLAIGVDTSGSIDQVLLQQFAGELQAIADEVRPRKIVVMYCDSAIHRTETFEPGDPIELHAVGRGGTDFRPVFAAVEQMEESPAAIVYLTDLAGTFPATEPEIPTLWVTGRENVQTVPFGELVLAN